MPRSGTTFLEQVLSSHSSIHGAGELNYLPKIIDKFNLYNKFETPWDGPRVCKKKNLKSIDFMRQKVVSKNLNYSFLRIDKEKDIQIFNNGGWHFNNILNPDQISLKLRTFAHSEFASEKFSSPEMIKKNIERIVVNIGAANVILTTVARGSFLKAIKIATIAINPAIHLLK